MLEVNNICKNYGELKALTNVTFMLEPGLYGLLGPNGAGKSTLMSIMVDNLKADQGEILWKGVKVAGSGIHKDNMEYRKVLGYAPQQQGLYDSYTGRHFLSYMAALKGISRELVVNEMERVAENVNLLDKLDEKIGRYSGGMKQRILIAQAMMGNPEIIILDEPTAGLDPKERVRLRNILAEMAKDTIVIVSTHVVSDVESVAKGIIIIKNGVIIEHCSPEGLIAKHIGAKTLEDVYMKIFGEEQMDAYSL